MNKVEEIITLLSQLASRIQTDPCPQLASLNQSLNLINEDESRVRVLHKALSLMCFKAPQVFDEELKCMVGTIVSVLNSCISCQVLSSFEKEECLRIGTLISRGNCAKLIQACFGIAGKLEKHETLKEMLLGAVLRVAVSASCYEGLSPRTPVLSLESGCGINASLLEIQHLFHEDISVTNNKIPLRLLLWYLDPLTLKHDVSEVLREVVERPFLDLKKELHDRLTWRSVVVCLALSPTKFIETRTLLHNWFLITGLASILEFQIKLVSSVLDVLSQPMGWSLSMEVGSQLPFSDAYFANEHNMLAVLLGPFSCESFLGLAHHIRESDILAQKCSHQTFEDNTTWKKLINYRSTWAQLIAFPEWFFFAAILLFSKNGCQFAFWSRCITSAVTTEHTCDAEQCCTAAARYLAYIISPMSEIHHDLLVKNLIQISESWIKRCSSNMKKGTSGCTKNLRKLELCDKGKDNVAAKEIHSQALRLWLKDFHDCHVRYWTDIIKRSLFKGARKQNTSFQLQNLLFRKISLGIFIGHSNLHEEGCELLLHYVATGDILRSTGTRDIELKDEIQKRKSTDDAVAGVRLVFDLFDVIESMSSSIFETDENRLSFVCQLKMKAVRFIVKCIKRLLEDIKDWDTCKMSMLFDLHKRLERWSYQEGDIIKRSKPLEDVLSALHCKIDLQ